MRIGLTRLLLGLLLAVCAALPALAERKAPVSLYFQADIVLAADGKITELAWHDAEKIPANLRQRLTYAAHSWQFKPGSMDGVPAETHTTLTLHMQASDLGAGQIGLSLISAYTGPFNDRRVSPDYPMDPLRRAVSAKLRVEVSIDEHGAYTTDVVDYKASDQDNRWREAFAESALVAVAAWDVQQESVAGHPVPARLSIVFDYCIDDYRWRSKNTLTPLNSPVDAVPPGTPVALDSAAKLLTDISKTKI